MDLGKIIKIIIWEENPDDDFEEETELIPIEIPELIPEEEENVYESVLIKIGYLK